MPNNDRWTQARFDGFIKSGLRRISQRWPPKYEAVKEARVAPNTYKCAGYNRESHILKGAKNIAVDHIEPVIPTDVGFTTWDEVIKRLFVDSDKLQVLCKDCHYEKSKAERAERKKKNVKVVC
jgi:hypothetical protein